MKQISELPRWCILMDELLGEGKKRGKPIETNFDKKKGVG